MKEKFQDYHDAISAYDVVDLKNLLMYDKPSDMLVESVLLAVENKLDLLPKDVTMKVLSVNPEKSYKFSVVRYMAPKLTVGEKRRRLNEIWKMFERYTHMESSVRRAPKSPGRRSKRKIGGGRRIRKHSGINQRTGRLRKGYRYSGRKLKSGLAEIVKV